MKTNFCLARHASLKNQSNIKIGIIHFSLNQSEFVFLIFIGNIWRLKDSKMLFFDENNTFEQMQFRKADLLRLTFVLFYRDLCMVDQKSCFFDRLI